MDLLSTFSDDDEEEADDIIYCNFSDEDDDDDLLELELLQRIRKDKWVHQRLNWLAHVKKLEHENLFARTYRMSLQAFTSLVDMLYQYISYDYLKYGFTSTQQPVQAEITVAIGLHWLAGGSYLDLKNVYCCSVDTIYKHRLLFIRAVNMCDLLKLKFPTSAAEICTVQAGFCNISSNSVITGCVGAIDGLLVVIKCPSMKASDNNPSSYYSGHYCCHGLNVQAICDSSCRFTFFAIAAPGKSSDQAAVEQTSLPTALDCLPLGSYIVGDAAYTLTDQCITPFTGSQRLNPTKDSFNYFLSQVRIRIEMAFGLLTTKWQILKKPLFVSLGVGSEVLECISRLHNYCIDMRSQGLSEDIAEIIPLEKSPLGWGYLPTVEMLRPSVHGTSQVRDAILGMVSQHGFGRPPHNIERHQQELHEINLM